MNFYFLVPGTGNFFCGTCLRDYALARALRAKGHTVKIVEMYLEHKVEGGEASDSPLFFGGINCYIQQKAPLFRKTPRLIDAVFDTKPMIRFAATKTGMTDAHELAALTLSMLHGEAGNQFKELNRMVDWLKNQTDKPDVVVLSNAMLSGVARKIRKELDCRVWCTLQGEDAFVESLGEYTDQVWAMLQANAEHIDLFVPVSEYYAQKMSAAMRLSPEKVSVVYNGIETEGYAPADHAPKVPTIGFLSRMCPPKGLEQLIEAFCELKQEEEACDWRLHIAGSQVNEDLAFVKKMKERIDQAGWGNDVAWFPNISKEGKQDFLRGLSLLCTPSRYDEAFGLYILEAWASGVPVVLPARGAIPELIELAGGGVACDDLRAGLSQAMADRDALKLMGRRGLRAVEERFTSKHMAASFLELV